MKKQICMIAYTNYRSDARVRREAETLSATGEYEVTFLALNENGTADAYDIENVKLVELNVKKYSGHNKLNHLKSYLMFFSLAFLKCNKLLAKRQLDIVHVYNMPNFLVLLGIFARFFGKKVILDIHDSTPETYFARYGAKANRLLFKILCWEEAICCRLASNIIAVNHVQRDTLIARGIPKDKITISMNVPDPKWFGVKNIIKTSFGTDRKKIIYHGTIAKRLGIDLAIRAFAKICQNSADLEFHIIGSGEGLDECRELSQLFDLDDRVHFSGKMLPLESLLAILKQMDVGIIANRNNAATELMLPVKLLEYIAMDIPVVVPRLKTIEYYFTDDMVSYFEPDDVDSLVNALWRLLQDENRRKTQVMKSKAFLDRYGWEKHRMDLLQLYKGI
jgi:glycosyltransferase involved in cell wall biosynthesis